MKKYITLLFSFLLAACTSVVNVDYDKSTDFNSFKTYSKKIDPVKVSQDTRVNSPFMLKRVSNEIDKVLSSTTYKAVSAQADMVIKYHLDIRQEVETQQSGFTFGIGTASRNTAMAFTFNAPADDTNTIDKLVLTIDIYKDKNLVWRGSRDYTLYKGAKPETYDDLIKIMVVDILKNFPPGKK